VLDDRARAHEDRIPIVTFDNIRRVADCDAITCTRWTGGIQRSYFYVQDVRPAALLGDAGRVYTIIGAEIEDRSGIMLDIAVQSYSPRSLIPLPVLCSVLTLRAPF
jgi:hypothetical protein